MGAKRSWWQNTKTHLITTALIVLFIAFVVLVIFGGYKLNWDWTGFNGNNKSGKSLWDWLQLFIIPLALAVIAIFFNRAERKNEQKIATDNQQEAALQEYIKEMSELLLEKDLRKSDWDAEVRTIARIRTLTVLPRLDKERKRSVLKFLYEARLLMSDVSIISLGAADLSRANLSSTLLVTIDLSGANLREANLEKAVLDAAILTDTNLRNAQLFPQVAQKGCSWRESAPQRLSFTPGVHGWWFVAFLLNVGTPERCLVREGRPHLIFTT